MRSVTLERWRDAHPAVRSRPGMALGRADIDGAWTDRAAGLYQGGTRAVRLTDPVHLCGPGATDAGPIALLRELTAYGVEIEWTAVCRAGCDDSRLLGHLFPPSRLDCGDRDHADRPLAAWRQGFFPARCVFRNGPGFLEVRDRRWGSLEMYTIDDPDWIWAVSELADGAAPATLPAAARAAFAEARLTLERGGRLWWLPARVRRWPFPPLLV